MTNSHYSKEKYMYKPGFMDRMEEGIIPEDTLGPIYRGMRKFFGRIEDQEPITDACFVVPIGPGESAETVERAYKSIVSQSYCRKKGRVDIIGVYNGAPEETFEATKGMADDFVYSAKALGYAGARVAGRKKATERKGKKTAIVCMDADMEMKDPGLLGKMIESLNRGYVGGLTNMFPDSDSNGEGPYYAWSRAANKTAATLAKIPVIGKYVPPFGNSFVYFRNDVGAEFNPELGVCEDVDMVTQLRKYGALDFIDGPGITASGRRVRKDGALASWRERANRWLAYKNGDKKRLSWVPEPVLQAA